MRRKLTAKTLLTIAPKGRRQEIWDTLLPGFGVRIGVSGKKAFFVMCRAGRRQKRVTLGHYPTLSLQEAREAARKTLANPIQQDDGTANSQKITVQQAVDNFIELYAKRKNRDWNGQWLRLDRNFVAQYGTRDIRAVTRADVITLLDGIVARGAPGQANRVLATIRKLFNWSVERGYIDVSPVQGMSAPAKERPRDRVLTDEELSRVWNASGTLGFPFGPLFRLLILTGQRRGEVSGMRWSEIDLSARTWSLPGNRTKNGRAHIVPLSDDAAKILRGLPRFLKSDFVFTTTGRSAVSGFGKLKDRLDDEADVHDWILHDLRRTAASRMAHLGVAPHVVEKILNHSSGIISGVAAVYNRYGYEDEKRAALTEWAAFLREISSGNRNASNAPQRIHDAG